MSLVISPFEPSGHQKQGHSERLLQGKEPQNSSLTCFQMPDDLLWHFWLKSMVYLLMMFSNIVHVFSKQVSGLMSAPHFHTYGSSSSLEQCCTPHCHHHLEHILTCATHKGYMEAHQASSVLHDLIYHDGDLSMRLLLMVTFLFGGLAHQPASPVSKVNRTVWVIMSMPPRGT